MSFCGKSYKLAAGQSQGKNIPSYFMGKIFKAFHILSPIYSSLPLPISHAYKTDPESHYFCRLALLQSHSPSCLCSSCQVLPHRDHKALLASTKSAFSAINPMMPDVGIPYCHDNTLQAFIFIVIFFTSRALILTFLRVSTKAQCWACRKCIIKKS